MSLIFVNNNIAQVATKSHQNRKNHMKIKEYEAYKSHILNYQSIEDLKTLLKSYDVKELATSGFFACDYAQVLDVLKEIYGDEFKRETYINKNGTLKTKNGETYLWTVYINKMAMAINKLMKENNYA